MSLAGKDSILVTGSTGFIGTYFCQYLSAANSTFFSLNLREENWESDWESRFLGTKTVVYLAGINEGKGSVQAYQSVNTLLSKKVFDAFVKSDAELFIFISSIKALSDEEIVGQPLSEVHASQPFSEYAKSKLAAENYVLNLALPDNKRVIVIRPCLVYGAGNLGNLNRLINLLKLGIPYPFSSYNNQRSLLYVENLCAVLKELHDKKIDSGIYHLSDNGYYSSTEIIKMISEVLGKRAKLWSVNKKLLVFIAKLGDFFQLPFNSKTLHKLTKNYRVSNSKLLVALNFKLPYTTQQGIKKTIANNN